MVDRKSSWKKSFRNSFFKNEKKPSLRKSEIIESSGNNRLSLQEFTTLTEGPPPLDSPSTSLRQIRPWLSLRRNVIQQPVASENRPDLSKESDNDDDDDVFIYMDKSGKIQSILNNKGENIKNKEEEEEKENEEDNSRKSMIRVCGSRNSDDSSSIYLTCESSSSSSDDDDEDDDEDDRSTLVAPTLSIASSMDDRVKITHPVIERLTKLFVNDLENVVEMVLKYPDSQRKFQLIQEVNGALRNLKTAVTMNSHFIILSSLLSNSIEQ